MPLPLASCADDISTDVCCSSIFDVADRIRCVASAAIECCFDPSCSDQEWRSYVSVGPRIAEPLGDALVVHMVGIAPSPASSSNTAQRLLPVGVHLANFDVMVVENGWPQIRANEFGEVIEVPDSNLINAIARHAYAHGEKMYRSLVDGVQRNTLFPVSTFGNLGNVQLSGLQPIQPAAFSVGWGMSVQVQITLPLIFEPGS
jgi:hypothetical protein